MAIPPGWRHFAMRDLEGKSIIVTGATRGIGRAIALETAARGANVAFNFVKSDAQAEELKAAIEALEVKAMAFKVDAGDLKPVREMVNAVKAALRAYRRPCQQCRPDAR